MPNYKILETKYGITEGGLACGPVSGFVVASIKFEVDGKIQYLSLDDYESMPTFFLTDEDIYEKLVNEVDDDEFLEYRDNHELLELDGIDLSSHEYSEIYESLYQRGSGLAYSLIKFIIAVTRLDFDKTDKLINESKGKFVTEIDIPETDDEIEYKESIEG